MIVSLTPCFSWVFWQRAICFNRFSARQATKALMIFLEILARRRKTICMSHQRKSWQEKLADNKGHPTVFSISEKQSKRWGSGTCVIPSPAEVNELMRRVPKGKLTTIDELRKA